MERERKILMILWFHIYCEKEIGGKGRKKERNRGGTNVKASMHRERSVALMGYPLYSIYSYVN